MQFYEVGGCVRDELLGVKSKDIDFTCVLEPGDTMIPGVPLATADPFSVMVSKLNQMGFKIFLETPDFLTVRAQFPKGDVSALPAGMVTHSLNNLTADFVLARKEGDYTDGRRPDKVEPGTLMDDLRRRDFTMNAIAKDSKGNLIDPFAGQLDIENKVIRAVGDPNERFEEDALRIMRAIRFSVTKGFDIDWETEDAMVDRMFSLSGVSTERVREELVKMFNHDPLETVRTLNSFDLFPILFDMGLNFEPTMKARVK